MQITLPQDGSLDYCLANQHPSPANIVIFGATGDLTKRKLVPALARMLRCNLVHPDSRIIGVVRKGADQWVDLMGEALEQYGGSTLNEDAISHFLSLLVPVKGVLEDPETYKRIAAALKKNDGETNALFYCAVPPSWYAQVAQGLGESGLDNEQDGYRRIVIEKPFGHDIESASTLNKALWKHFNESQIYRIDHYLGKESVQNLFVFRFANSILEPLWNRNYIDHVQISAAETLGVEYRAPYYEKSGALRDMIQSHLMQVMTLVAMEPPVDFKADDIRDEKVKVLRAVRPIAPNMVNCHTLAAQYTTGVDSNGEELASYRRELGVASDSVTETFAAAKFYIDNWRWRGVPFILWSGKRMQEKMSEVVIRFREPPHNFFAEQGASTTPNALIFRLQPDEGMFLRMNAKLPGLTMDMQRMVLHAPYKSEEGHIYDAYEILLQDVLTGDSTLFSRADEIEESWQIMEPILQNWKDRSTITEYHAGSCCVPGMDQLLEGCASGWHKPTR
jgi:glucose-6-phosphate 1-dehydrogenase